ncbi:MAG: hypothetical protein AAGD96_19250 [Chloroflexota bacterium]
MGKPETKWQNVEIFAIHDALALARSRSMSPQPPTLQSPNPPQPEKEYNSFFDRLLISLGDKAIKYWPFIVIAFLILFLSIGALVGGILAIRAVGERFNQLDVKQQQRIIMEEQLQEQTAQQPAEEELEAVGSEEVDQSEWFKIIEDDELEDADIFEDSNEAQIEDDSFLEETENESAFPVPEQVIIVSPPPRQLIIAQDNTWELSCSGRGLFEIGSSDCVLDNPQPLPADDLAATSN